MFILVNWILVQVHSLVTQVRKTFKNGADSFTAIGKRGVSEYRIEP